MIQSCQQCLDCLVLIIYMEMSDPFWHRQVGEVRNCFYTVFSAYVMAISVRASVVHLCCDKYLL